MAANPQIVQVKPNDAVAVAVEPQIGDSSIQDTSMDEQCAKYAEKDPGFFEKGNISNIATFVIMVAGIAMRFGMDIDWDQNVAGRYVLAFGLFGFAGGVTNWLAITMLFDEVPGLYGSGIIPKQFEQIKSTMKTMIMDTFFDPKFLEKQLKDKIGEFTDPKMIETKLTDLLDSPTFDKMLDDKLASIGEGPMGLMLSMMNMTGAKIKPFLKPFVSGIAKDVGPMLSKMMEGEGALPVLKIREEVNKLMDDRLKLSFSADYMELMSLLWMELSYVQELTADRVKKLIEVIMKTHLGWLVVWGNIFGGLIGIVSEAVGY